MVAGCSDTLTNVRGLPNEGSRENWYPAPSGYYPLFQNVGYEHPALSSTAPESPLSLQAGLHCSSRYHDHRAGTNVRNPLAAVTTPSAALTRLTRAVNAILQKMDAILATAATAMATPGNGLKRSGTPAYSTVTDRKRPIAHISAGGIPRTGNPD